MAESVTISDDFNDIAHVFGKLGVDYNLEWDSIPTNKWKKLLNGEKYAVKVGGQIFGETDFDWSDKKRDLDGDLMFDNGGVELSNSKIKDRIVNFVKGNDLKIPEKVEKWREAQQAKAGGDFTPDYGVDGIGDALAALGSNEITFVPVDKIKESVSGSNSSNGSNNAMENSTKKMGLGVAAVAAAGFALYKVIN